MSCEQVKELLSPYLDKMTTDKENKIVETHLQMCSHCAHQLEEMGRIRVALKYLDTPQVPDNFAGDLHKLIDHEKIKYFPSREALIPKKGGWIAAAVAGVALSFGIFASSFIPYGAIMASLQDWRGNDNKPPIAVVDNNKIIQNWINRQLDAVNDNDNNSVQTDPVAQGSSKNNGSTSPGENTDISPTISPPIEVAVQEKIGYSYTAKIQVTDMEESMHEIIQLAYDSGAQMGVKSANVMSATDQVKVVNLKVTKDKTDQLLSDLAKLGIEAPLQNEVTYTQAYNENQIALAALETDIEKLRDGSNLTEQQQTQLQNLLKQKQDLQAEQVQIDKETDYATIEVRILEKNDSQDSN